MKQFYGIVFVLIFAGCFYKKSPEMRLCSRLDWNSVVAMFPKNVHDVHALTNKSIACMNEMLDTLKNQSPSQRNFHNTVRVYDNAKFKFIMNLQILSILAALSSDQSIRSAAEDDVMKLQEFQADTLLRNPILLEAFQDYAYYGHDDQSKTVSTRSFLQKSIERLEHEGANLVSDKLATLNRLSRDIAHLEGRFLFNIAHHRDSIVVADHELAGVPNHFIAHLQKKNNEYIIPLTYDLFFAVLENCTSQETRKKMFIAFSQRAYPENYEVLTELIKKRNEYAQLVGYKNFAEYECSMQMIGSVQRAQDFITDIVRHANKVVTKEFAQLIKELPESVVLGPTGKLQPWDEAFVKTVYRKKHYDIDVVAVSEYFPISHVMEQLQRQFGGFFALSFDEVPCHGLWHKDLKCIRVRLLKSSEIIGYIVFDLYSRPGKSEQSSEINVIPTIQDDCSLACSGFSTIITNFVQEEGKETLLEFHDVKILLHEFGHALHELFGATDFVDFTGTKGPRDFIEVPSQLLEMWMDDPLIIREFSQHYATKKPLSDSMIQKIIEAEKFGRASLLQRQCLLSLISLHFGTACGQQDPHQIVEKLYKDVRCDVEYNSQDYFETTFDHIVTYGSHYYGYVWSQVLAAGLFEYVCDNGITSTKVGQKLYESLLSHGGSKDPHTLIELLLGTTVTKQSLLDSLEK